MRNTSFFERRSESAVSASDLDLGFQMIGRALLRKMRESHRQCRLRTGRPQVPYATTGIGEPFPNKLPRAIDLLTGFENLRLRQQMGSKLKLRRDADEVLCQSVVNLTRDAGAFREDRSRIASELHEHASYI